MSTSPSPFRSNILKAISKFLWGATLKERKKERNNKKQRPVNEDTKAQQKKKKAQIQKDFIQKQFSIILAILIRKCRSWELLPTSFIVLLLPKVSARRLGGGDVAWTKFIPFTGGKSTKSRHYLICLMTINRKWHCSKTSSLLHTVQYQFGQRTFLQHCRGLSMLCEAACGWWADLDFG